MQETLQGITRQLVTRLWPDGGQGRARRNAWASMVEDNVRARARTEAENALRETPPVGATSKHG